MRLRRLPALALLGAGTVAACTPDNSPDLTAPSGYSLDLRTSPATVTLNPVAADSTTGTRVTTAVHNTVVADTALQRVGVLGGGLTYTVRFETPADSLKFTFGNATGLTGNLAGRWAPAAVSATPGLYNFNIRRRRTTAASSGTANVIVEFTDVNNGNRTLADTIRVTSN